MRFCRPCGSTLQVCYMVFFNVVFRVFTSLNLYTPIGGIKVLGVPLGSLSFISSFFQEALDDDV